MGIRARVMTAASAAAVAFVAAGCSQGGLQTSNPGDPIDLGVPGERIDTVLGVEYYPACANELLTYEGTVWFPFTPENAEDYPVLDAPVAGAAPAGGGPGSPGGPGGVGGVGGVGASAARPLVVVPLVVAPPVVEPLAGAAPLVVAPGPGDDVGSLTFFEGGFAYWVSESGDIATWLTTTKLAYNWVC